MNLGSVIVNRLESDTAITALVGNSIYPNYRDDVVPSLVYDISQNDNAETDALEGRALISAEVVISVIAKRYEDACPIADAVFSNLDYAEWIDSGVTVVSCFFSSREEDYIEQASKNKRLAVIDLRFDLLVS